MAEKYLVKPFLWKGLAIGIFVVFLLAVTPQHVHAQETGNFCVQDYLAGANCTANDVRIESLRIIDLVKPCYVAPTGVMDVVFEALVSSQKSPDRYDIGLFLALDGGSALTGNSCYHDFLPPPITTTPTYGDFNSDGIPDIYNGPWWNGESGRADTCGDIASNTQVFRVTQQIRVACVDQDGNGHADIHVCSSWDQNTGTDCNGVQQAFPGTGSKCGCAVVNFDFTPTAIDMLTFSARNESIPAGLALAALGLLVLSGILLSVYARYRMRKNKPA
jgi:hypothetical protein